MTEQNKKQETLLDLILHVSDLKCDARDCDYYEHNVSHEDYYKWIEHPCPKCGASLLTFEDYNKVERMKETINKLDCKCTRWLARLSKRFTKKKYKVEMNGTGKTFKAGTDKEIFKEL